MKNINKKFLLGVSREMLVAIDKESRRLKTDRTRLIRKLIAKYFEDREREKFVEDLRKQHEDS